MPDALDYWSGTLCFDTNSGLFYQPSKLAELRDKCAPTKTEKPKKPTPITDHEALAIFNELKETIDAQAKRIETLEKGQRSLRNWALNKFFGPLRDG